MFECSICGSSLEPDEDLDLCPECRPAFVWESDTDEEDWFESEQMRDRWLNVGLQSEQPIDPS